MAEGQATEVAAPTALSQDVVSRIDAILASEKPEPAPRAAQPPAKPAAPESPEPPAEAQEEEAPAGPNKGVEGEDAEPADAQTTEIPLDQLESIAIEVEVESEGGKVTEKPTVKELKLGYMRQKDYQKKTAEVARQREEVQERTRQAIEGERGQYQKSLQELTDLLIETAAPELKDVDWNHLSKNDAAEYVRLHNRREELNRALSTIQAKQKEATDKQRAELKKAREDAATKARAQLEADIPGFNDVLYQSLMKSAEKFGYKPEEVGTWIDPRAIKLLHAATLAQSQTPAKPPAEKKVVAVPKAIRPGASAENALGQQRHEAAMKQLRKTGSVQDAAAVLRARLGDSLNKG